jgi:hypothetical protein
MKLPHAKRFILGVAGLAMAGVMVTGQTQAFKPFQGSWKGTISIAGVDLEIRLNFSLDENQKPAGTFDSISQGITGLKLGDIKVEGKDIHFILDEPNVQGEPTFKGTLDEAAGKITGTFTQSGYSGTFAVEKEKVEGPGVADGAAPPSGD